MTSEGFKINYSWPKSTSVLIICWYKLACSPRENYFRSAGQNVRQAFIGLPDILIPCRTLFSVNDQRILNSAGQNVRQYRTLLPDISKSLPDMSGIFREDWAWFHVCYNPSKMKMIFSWCTWKFMFFKMVLSEIIWPPVYFRHFFFMVNSRSQQFTSRNFEVHKC